MNDDRYLDNFESYLRQAGVVAAGTWSIGGAHTGKVRLVLEGGVYAVAKPASGIGNGEQLIRAEVAAWAFARELGWSDMVACTVLRDDVPGVDGEASVHVLWPEDAVPDAPIDRFEPSDTWRAAIFDVVVDHADRGHNWLGHPDPGGAFRLKLIDHGFAFGIEGRAPQSTFYAMHHDQQIPAPHLLALRRALHPRQERYLRGLFEANPGALGAALNRIQALLETGMLRRQSP